MITAIHLHNFKSFAGDWHRIPLGPLTLMVGTNASGKSNVRDALRFLHGTARSYLLSEILGEKYGEGGGLEWKGIRGGAREAVFGANGGEFLIGCDVKHTTHIRAKTADRLVPREWSFRYSMTLKVNARRKTAIVSDEELYAGNKAIFSTKKLVLKAVQSEDGKQILVRYSKQGQRKFIGPTIKLRCDQPLVSQLLDHPDVSASTRTACRAFLNGLESMRFLDLDPQALRRPSLPGQVILGDKGDNLSSVLQALCEDPVRREAFVEWTKELTPLDVEELRFDPVSLDGKIQLALEESGGRIITAESASDGTLRFLAYAAALLGTKPAATYVFEEIENGIHPNRVHLLLELLQQATEKGTTQVIATTHSPALLNFLRGKALENALLVTRHGPSSRVRCLKDLPMADDDKIVAGDLLESGWFENITAFLNAEESEAEEETEP